ncbi:flavodoxin family protein [Anaerococcus provencensis]|uniref:flavodoxin family protein n=1 Tax=Anaerococcus provencensis TaxID=938293 RepID=UPI000316BAFA|nr:flavodoxin family protein [Anaerococcus provencensis]
MNEVLIIYSSKTGNTKKVAEAIKEVNPYATILPTNLVNEKIINESSHIIMGYWIDKGMPDKNAMDIIEKIHNKKVGIFFTLGAYSDSDHAKKAEEKSIILFNKNNNEVLKTFKCQGKIDPELTLMFENLPADHPHAMNEERRKRHLDAKSHPDENDLKMAREVFKDFGDR